MAESVKAQLGLLYRSGKETFPARANALAAAAQTIGEVHAAWYAPTTYAGSPTALVKAMEINASVYSLLRRAVLSWQDVSHALVAIADDFRDTDAEAARIADSEGFKLDTLKMPALPEPPPLTEVIS